MGHTVGWWSGVVVIYSALASINEVDQRRARLVQVGDRIRVQFPVRDIISVCDQPPRSTQPGHRLVGRRNEYQPKGGDALRLGSKGNICSSSDRQHLSYDVCLELRGEIIRTVLCFIV